MSKYSIYQEVAFNKVIDLVITEFIKEELEVYGDTGGLSEDRMRKWKDNVCKILEIENMSLQDTL